MEISKQALENYLPIWCYGCEEPGYIFVEDVKQPVFVVCEKCGYETAEVWCESSGMGGEFVRKIEERPERWMCPDCDQEYELPGGFYENPVALVLESDLPGDVKAGVGELRQVGKLQGELIKPLFYLVFFAVGTYTSYCINAGWIYLPGLRRGYILEGISLVFWVAAIWAIGLAIIAAVFKPVVEQRYRRNIAILVGFSIMFFTLALSFAKYGMVLN